jgi:hypothetical protein
VGDDNSGATPREYFMYVDVRRRLVFFDKSIRALNIPCLVQHDFATGVLHPVKGAEVDDVVTHATNDGRGLALSSAEWLRVRGKNRHRLTFLRDGGQTYRTDKFMFFWARFDPSGNYALVSGDAARRRPFVIEVNTGDVREQIAQNLDARSGDIDPLDGRLWAPDGRTDNFLLSVDCRTGDIKKIRIPLGGRAARVRFAHDGASLFVIGSNNVIMCCDRDGSIIWSTNFAEYGENIPAFVLSNESGSHLCAPLWKSRRSAWGEDIIISADKGHVEKTIVRHGGPPARLATDWFGDHLLTYSGEIIDFFTGKVIGSVNPR